MQMQQTKAEFQPTRWTLVHALRCDDEADRRGAQEELIARYWPAVYAVLRRRGLHRDAAAEITQAFFTDVVLGRELLAQGDPQRGRLRSLIVVALSRYQIDQHRRTVSRGSPLQLTTDQIAREERFAAENSGDDLQRLFDRRWAVATLDRAVARCRQYCLDHDLERHWEAFDMQVITPATNGNEPPSLQAIADHVGFDTPQHVASATKVVRKRLHVMLQEAIGSTLADPDEQQEEFDYLLQLLT